MPIKWVKSKERKRAYAFIGAGLPLAGYVITAVIDQDDDGFTAHIMPGPVFWKRYPRTTDLKTVVQDIKDAARLIAQKILDDLKD